MGTEIVGLFLIVPPVLLLCNIWQLRKKSTRNKALVLMALGISFFSYFCISAYLEGYLMQGFLVGSFCYGPFYFVAWVVVTLILKATHYMGVKNASSHPET